LHDFLFVDHRPDDRAGKADFGDRGQGIDDQRLPLLHLDVERLDGQRQHNHQPEKGTDGHDQKIKKARIKHALFSHPQPLNSFAGTTQYWLRSFLCSISTTLSPFVSFLWASALILTISSAPSTTSRASPNCSSTRLERTVAVLPTNTLSGAEAFSARNSGRKGRTT